MALDEERFIEMTALPLISNMSSKALIAPVVAVALVLPRVVCAAPSLPALDLVASNGNIVVSSEHPFGAVDAVTSVREYDTRDGRLVRVFSPNEKVEFRKPRGLRFANSRILYCVARDEVVGFDFTTGECLGATVRLPRLNGQALALFP